MGRGHSNTHSSAVLYGPHRHRARAVVSKTMEKALRREWARANPNEYLRLVGQLHGEKVLHLMDQKLVAYYSESYRGASDIIIHLSEELRVMSEEKALTTFYEIEVAQSGNREPKYITGTERILVSEELFEDEWFDLVGNEIDEALQAACPRP